MIRPMGHLSPEGRVVSTMSTLTATPSTSMARVAASPVFCGQLAQVRPRDGRKLRVRLRRGRWSPEEPDPGDTGWSPGRVPGTWPTPWSGSCGRPSSWEDRPAPRSRPGSTRGSRRRTAPASLSPLDRARTTKAPSPAVAGFSCSSELTRGLGIVPSRCGLSALVNRAHSPTVSRSHKRHRPAVRIQDRPGHEV